MKPGMVQTAEMADRQEFLFYYAEAGPAGLGEKKQKKKTTTPPTFARTARDKVLN